MTDIARLGLQVDSSPVAMSTADLDRLGDQAAVTQGQVTRSTTAMSRGFAATGTASRAMQRSFNPQGVRMVALQLSQVAQQAQAGGGFLRALSIQAADIGLAFGTVGIAAGVAVGAIIPLAQQIFDIEADTRDLTERVDDLDGAWRGLASAQDLAASSTDDLIDRYGVVNNQIRSLIEGLQAVSLRQFRAQVESTIAGFEDIDGAVGGALDTLQLMEVQSGRNLRGLEQNFAILPQAVQDAASAIQNFTLSSAESLEVQRDRALSSARALEQLNDTDYDDAIASLFRFADIASQQLARVESQANITAEAMNRIPSGGDLFNAYGGILPGESLIFGGQEGDINKRGRGGAGSRLSAEQREAARIFDQTRTAVEAYEAELADLDELYQAGYLSAETYARAQRMVGEEFDKTELRELRRGVEGFSETLVDAAVNAENLADVFDGALRQMASSLLSSGLQQAILGPLAGSDGIFGTIFSGIGLGLGGGEPAPRAAGGPVSGGRPYMVGERGRELFVPQQAGRIVPNDALGGVKVQNIINDMRSNGADIEQTQRTGPDGTLIIETTVRDAISGGRMDGALGPRFGVTPTRLRR